MPFVSDGMDAEPLTRLAALLASKGLYGAAAAAGRGCIKNPQSLVKACSQLRAVWAEGKAVCCRDLYAGTSVGILPIIF